MKHIFLSAIIAAFAVSAFADPNTGIGHTGIVDDADSGWTWSGMTPYSDIGLSKGTGHAGGPGSYGIYTFDGTSVDIYTMRGASVDVDGRVHRIGKLKISIDGHEKTEVSLSNPSSEFDFQAYSITGLSPKIHVLQVEPDGGWAVVDYIKVGASSSSVETVETASEAPAAGPGLLFYSKDAQLSAANSVEAASNVSGFNNGISPELQVGDLPADWGLSPIYAHSGNSAIRYSGSMNAGPAFCYMYAYGVKIPVAANTWLGYWILPQQDNGRYVAVDIHCTDGTSLSQTEAVDADGISVAPSAGHGGSIPLYTWSPVRCHIGDWLAGKTIDKIWIGFARQNGAGQYRGYIDDLVIDNEKPTSKPNRTN